MLIYSTLIHSLAVLRFLIGPFKSQLLFALVSLSQNFISLQALYIHDAIVLIRIFYKMWSRHPTGLQGESVNFLSFCEQYILLAYLIYMSQAIEGISHFWKRLGISGND
jgi:hypothetical protein